MMTPILPVYNRADIAPTRGEGYRLYDDAGNSWIDFCAGIAVCGLGHCHPELVKTLTEQAGKLWHVSNLYRIPGQEALAKLWTEQSFADTVFFTNSGVEAWECAVKLIRHHFATKGEPQRYRIITFDGNFHGRTLAAISASKTEKMIGGFGPLVDGFDKVPFGDLAAVEAAIGPETAAINIEPVQGEGGLRACTPEFLQGLRALCDKHGLLLFLDEIQCGAGRTGKLFAHEWAGVKPDIVSAAKGIGGGFPLGACLATAHAAEGMSYGSHGTTYGGNPLAMAVGLRTLELLTAPGFLDGVNDTAAALWRAFKTLMERRPEHVVELRGKGLMMGVRLAGVENLALIAELRKNGLLAAAAQDNVVRLLPPLTIDAAAIAAAIEIFDRSLTALAAGKAAA